MSIAAVSGVVALIASGVAISAELINNRAGRTIARDRNIGSESVTKVNFEMASDVVTETVRQNRNQQGRFFRVIDSAKTFPLWVDVSQRYTRTQMADNIRVSGWSSLTYLSIEASAVMAQAFPTVPMFSEPFNPNSHIFIPHFHFGTPTRRIRHPDPAIARDHTVHSFHFT